MVSGRQVPAGDSGHLLSVDADVWVRMEEAASHSCCVTKNIA